jgi:short-subunit dehydrogenase
MVSMGGSPCRPDEEEVRIPCWMQLAQPFRLHSGRHVERAAAGTAAKSIRHDFRCEGNARRTRAQYWVHSFETAKQGFDTKGSRLMSDISVGDSGASIDNLHVLLVGAGPGLGMAIARRFALGGYRVTLVARSTDGLRDLAGSLAETGARINTIVADASDPEALGARMAELYNEQGAPGLIIYNAVVGSPDQLLNSSVQHLQMAYAVDVISAIVVTQVAAPAMRAAGFGTIIVTGGGFADNPIPALATVSLGKAALRSAATMLGADLEPDGIRVATLTIAGQIVAGTAFDPENIAKRYWEVVHSDVPWQAEFRFTGE